MDAMQKKVAMTIVAGLAKKGALAVAALLTGHGIAVSGSMTEIIASALVMVAVAGYGVWTDYLKAIVFSQLDVLKAKSIAQAEAMRRKGVAEPDARTIAAASQASLTTPSLTADDVTKAAATLPVDIAGKLGTGAVVLLLALMCLPSDAHAQLRKGPIAAAVQAAVEHKSTTDPAEDLLGALEAKLLPDLKYALNISNANGNDLTSSCWKAWIDMIEARQKANLDEQGNPVDMPSPALITKFQKLVDIRNALQPTSPFMRACSPVGNMVKMDIRRFIGVILSGGVGLASLGIGL